MRNARLVATMDGDRRELAGGWVADRRRADHGRRRVDRAEPPTAAEMIDAGDCLVTPGLDQHPPPPVPEPHPRLPADDRQAAVRLAAIAVPAVAGDRRGGGVRQRVRRSGRAGARRVHDVDRPPLPPPARRRRPARRRDRRRDRAGHALPPDARLDVAEREGRRPAARRRGRRRRRDPRRQRGRRRQRTTIARTGRWCASRSRRAARSASPRR